MARRGAKELDIGGDLLWAGHDAARKSLSTIGNGHLRKLQALFERIDSCEGNASWNRIAGAEKGTETCSDTGEQELERKSKRVRPEVQPRENAAESLRRC